MGTLWLIFARLLMMPGQLDPVGRKRGWQHDKLLPLSAPLVFRTPLVNAKIALKHRVRGRDLSFKRTRDKFAYWSVRTNRTRLGHFWPKSGSFLP
jgi:hypothetical protein